MLGVAVVEMSLVVAGSAAMLDCVDEVEMSVVMMRVCVGVTLVILSLAEIGILDKVDLVESLLVVVMIGVNVTKVELSLAEAEELDNVKVIIGSEDFVMDCAFEVIDVVVLSL